MNYIGEYIRKYRGDISLRDFAEKCGISHTHLDSIEKGIDPRTGKPVKVTVETLKKVAKAMNMTINDLLIASGDVKIDDLIFDNVEVADINDSITQEGLERKKMEDLSVLENVLYTHKDKIDSVKNLPKEKQQVIANAVKSVLDMIDDENSNQ